MEQAGLEASASRKPSTTRHGADATLSRLYLQRGHECDGEMAKLMARIALDLAPASIEALDLLERVIEHDERRELCERYESFLREVPFHPQSMRVREALIDLLLEQRAYDAALRHVSSLNPISWLRAPREQIVRACDVPPPEYDRYEPLDTFEVIEELEYDTSEYDYEVNDGEYVEVAE